MSSSILEAEQNGKTQNSNEIKHKRNENETERKRNRKGNETGKETKRNHNGNERITERKWNAVFQSTIRLLNNRSTKMECNHFIDAYCVKHDHAVYRIASWLICF